MPQPPNRLENLQTLRMANADIAFATAFATLVGGAFLVGFIKHLGGTDIWIGLLTAIPSLLGILQIPGALIGRTFESFKRYVLPGGLLWRIFYLPLIALPLLPIDPQVKLWILALAIGIGSAATLMVNPIYNDWLAEMIPNNSRGWYFSRRNAIASAVGAVIGTLGGLLLDAMRQADLEALGFTYVFALGSVCSAISFGLFLRMKDIPRVNPIRQDVWSGLRSVSLPFRDREFRSVLVFFVVFVTGQLFAGNLFAAYAIESLELPFAFIQIMGASHAIGTVAFARYWGFLADKYGNKPVLIILAVGLTLTPIMWLFTYPGADLQNRIVLSLGHVYSGAVWGGVALCQFNLLLATAKPEDRANYLGAGLALQAIVGGVAPLLGATLMMWMRPMFDPVLAYKIVFMATITFRFLSIFFLFPIREVGATRVTETLQHLRKVTPRGVRAMRRLAASADPASRVEAIESVGVENYALASDQIIKALEDPSPQVRRQAASTLAKLRDPRSVQALLQQLDEHPDLVEEETVEALGDLGDEAAVPILNRMLASPSPLLRRAAAKALGRIGSDESAQPLLEAAQDGDPDLRRASLQALRYLAVEEAGTVAIEALDDPHPSVRVAAAELIAHLKVEAAAPSLRASLRKYEDEAANEAAYALGVVGSVEDADLILDQAARAKNPSTRRRCLLGLARLIGVESEAYRLMLLEGMARDSLLLEMLRPAMRGRAQVRTALDLFSSGSEERALEVLAEAEPGEMMASFAHRPVDELFLVAAALLAKAAQPPGQRSGPII
jgi:HEAT repeat protein